MITPPNMAPQAQGRSVLFWVFFTPIFLTAKCRTAKFKIENRLTEGLLRGAHFTFGV